MNNQALTMEKFLQYLQTLQKDYTRLGDLLRKKREAVLLYDLEALDDIMKDEQAYVLLSKGFNTNIEAFREALSLRGATLSQVIDNMPDQWQPKFREVFGPLKEAIDNVRACNEECQAVLEQKLEHIGKRIEKLGGAGGKSYGQQGGAIKDRGISPGSLDKSI